MGGFGWLSVVIGGYYWLRVFFLIDDGWLRGGFGRFWVLGWLWVVLGGYPWLLVVISG